MRLLYAFFAKYADLMKDGTVTASSGCFEAIKVQSLPCVVPALYIVVRIRVEAAECGSEHLFQINKIIGPSGKALETPEHPPVSFVSQLEPGVEYAGFTAVMHVSALFFESDGLYQIVFTVDRTEIGTLELSVVSEKKTGATP